MIKLLIVDDEKYICLGHKKMIEMMDLGVECVCAFSVEKALEIVNNEPIDLLITDLSMPGSDGFKLMEELLSRDIRSIVISGYGSFDYVKKAMKLNACDFILKPVNRAELKASIEKQLEEIERAKTETPEASLTGCQSDREFWENFGEFYDKTRLPAQGDSGDGEFDRIINYINDHADGNFNLATLSNEADMNYSYFSRRFKEKVGMPFQEYMARVKIKRAIEMLLTTDLQIRQISDDLGYSESKYFIQVFKKYTGSTPAAYRLAHKK